MSQDKARLSNAIDKSIKKVFKDALSYIELSDISKPQYHKVRKLVLRSGNDEIRKITEELDKYEVKYTPRYDEQIDFDDKD